MTNNKKTLGGLARASAYLRVNQMEQGQHDYAQVGRELDKSIRDWIADGSTHEYHVDLDFVDVQAALAELTVDDLKELSKDDYILYLEYLLAID